MSQLKYIFYSIRPSAGLMACVLALAAFRPPLSDVAQTIILILYFFSGSSFCFLINDWFDIKKDLANDKLRPIATGQLLNRHLIVALALFALVFLISGWLMHSSLLWLALAAIVSFIAYSPINQHSGLAANLFVAFWAAAPVWQSLFINPAEKGMIAFSIGLMLFVTIREVFLDWLDMTGDEITGKPSLPLRLNASRLKWFLSSLLALGTLTFTLVIWKMEASIMSRVFMALSVLLIWVPFFGYLKNPNRKVILFNIRFSHVSFACLTIGLFVR